MSTRKNVCKNCEKWSVLAAASDHNSCTDSHFVNLDDVNSVHTLESLAYFSHSNEGAAFVTGPEFGCIFFKKRGGEQR